MNESFKKLLSKCFLYTLLCIFVFALLNLLGCFIAGNTNVFKWHYGIRFAIVFLSIQIPLYYKINKETK